MAVPADQSSSATAQRWRVIAEPAAVMAAATAVFLAIYRPWGHRFRVPFSYGQDSVFYAMLIKTMTTEGGYGQTSSLGAPHGQQLYDFPLGGERLHLLLWKVLTVFSKDPYFVLNVGYALSFPLVALSAYLVLRHLRVRWLLAGSASILYAFLPYHHWHGEQHPTLSAYYSVPLLVLVALWAAEGGLPVLPKLWRAWEPAARRRRIAALVVIALIIGMGSPYYAVFGVFTITASGALRAARDRRLQPIITAVVMCAAIGFVLVASLAPELKYRLDHGSNPDVANRVSADSETYGLHITQMLVPYPSHQIDKLASLGRKAADVTSVGEGGSYLGVVGVVGFGIGIGSLVWTRKRNRTWQRVKWLGGLMVFECALGTVGGLGFLLAVFGFTQTRNWGRVVVVIGFMALTVVALLADRAMRKLSGRRAVLIGGIAVLVVTLGGIFDEVPAGTHPDYALIDGTYQSDKVFFAQMESALPDGAMVFQLPYVPFPESPPVVNMTGYDHMRGYVLGTNKLRWSAGGVRGRISDWQETWATLPTPQMIDGLAAAGFSAIYIDSSGYTDGAASLSSQIDKVTGPRAAMSPNGRMWWYDIRPIAAQLTAKFGAPRLNEIGQAVVTTPKAAVGGSISFQEVVADGPFRWMGGSGTITFNNLGTDGRTMRLRTTAVGPDGTHLTLKGAGVDLSVVLSTKGTPIDTTFALRAGASELVLSTDAPVQPVAGDGRDLRIRLNGLVVADAAVIDILGR